MLKQWEKPERPSDEKLEGRLKDARMKLQEQQLKVKEHGLPVLVLVEGWGTAGKGSLIGQIIKNIDPRFFKVESMSAPTEEEKRKPFFVPSFCEDSGKRQVQFLRFRLDGRDHERKTARKDQR